MPQSRPPSVATLDEILADAERIWRAWRRENSLLTKAQLQALSYEDARAYEQARSDAWQSTYVVIPEDKARLLALAGDDRVWDHGDSGFCASSVQEAVKDALIDLIDEQSNRIDEEWA